MSELHIESLDRREDPDWNAVGRRGDPDPWAEAPPDPMRRMVAWRAGTAVARAAFGTVGEMVGVEGRAGVVGWYEAVDEAAGVALLRRARQALGKVGAEQVIGPLDWSIWRRYRLALRDEGPDEPPPFLTEPWNSPAYPAHFEAAGFRSIAEYQSRIVPASPEDGIRALQARNRLRSRGIELRPLAIESLHEEADRVHRLLSSTRASERFYTAIPLERFRTRLQGIRAYLEPSLVHLAVAGRALVGFVMAFADPLAPAGDPRVVLRTLAVAPERRDEGIGAALTALVHEEASNRGASIIHALLEPDADPAGSGSEERPTRLFRRYRLYAAPAGE